MVFDRALFEPVPFNVVTRQSHDIANSQAGAAPGPLQISISELLWSCAGTISWLASDPPFLGEGACYCVVQRRWPVEINPATPNAESGIGLKLFGITPESRSRSLGIHTDAAFSIG